MGDIFFYSDTNCLTQISDGSVEGASDGTCTQFDISSFGSFEVRSLGPGCVVTVYGNDVAYCSSDKREVVALGACISNTTVNQFSVDGCSDQSSVESSSTVTVGGSTVVVGASASAVGSANGGGTTSGSASGSRTADGSTTRTSVATTTTTGSNGSVSILTVSVIATAPASSDLSSTDSSTDESTGLSTGAKAGIGVGVALAIITLIAVIAFFVLRRKKRPSTPPVHPEEKESGPTTMPAPAPPYGFVDEKKHHELPPEGRPVFELPQRAATSGLAEAPGDYTWAAPQEMEAGKGSRGEHAELTGSMPKIAMRNG